MPKLDEPFAHLHLHTDFSFLDGVGRAAEYAELAAQAGHTHLACTDHGGLHGLPGFRDACRKFGIQPVYGCELYVNDTRDDTATLNKERRSAAKSKDEVDPTFVDNHLVVLCQSPEGWKNLLRINHDSVRNGYYYRPRTTHQFVLDNSEGLICTTACMGSQFGRLAQRGELGRLRELLATFRDAMPDRFFGEIHVSEVEGQAAINEALIRECTDLGIPLVLASDVHYACNCDAERQDEMIAVARHTPLNDPNAFKLSARQLFFTGVRHAHRLQTSLGYGYSARFMRDISARALEIAQTCKADIYPTGGSLHPPRSIDDAGVLIENPSARLAGLAVDGIKQRFPGGVPKPYGDRLRHELNVIKRLGLADFFLVTLDIVNECKRRGVLVWTRGSGCASLVAAATGITQVNPIKFNLLFERFMDPASPNVPDFDLDIDATRRDEIAQWMVAKYGGPNGDHVARISAISTFGLRAAIRDVLFCHGETDKHTAFTLSGLADDVDVSLESRLAECKVSDRASLHAEALAAFREAANGRTKIDEMIDKHESQLVAAFTMVGRARNRQQHAAGYVVAPGPLVDYLPIDKVGSGKDQAIVTAWDEGQAAQRISPAGLMKVDMLSLETVGVVSRAAALASARTGNDVMAELDPWSMNYEDPDVLREYCTGQGFGLHQLTAADGQLARFMARLKPTSVNDVIAAIAMYRPGSLSFLDEFLQRKPGEVPDSPHPTFTEITAETRGIVVYQEQVMALLHRLGGIELRTAYKVIKAISKKDDKVIDAQRAAFIAGAQVNGLTEEVATDLWHIVEKFAGYGFNKCVSGGTLLRLAGANGSTSGAITVSQACAAFRSNTPLGKKMRSGRWRILRMDPDGRVRPGSVKAVHDNGIAETIEIGTSGGKRIRVTANHRLLGSRGYVQADRLKVGDSLVCMGNPAPQYVKRGRVSKSGYAGSGFPSGEDNPAFVDGSTPMLASVKADVALRANGRCEFCDSVGSGRMEFAHLKPLAVCDFDLTRYHSPSNVRYSCNPCHKQLDYDKGERRPAWSKGRPTTVERVVSIKHRKAERVYDVEMVDSPHNYVANGIVSHNSHAASYGVLSWMTAYLRAKYPADFWHAWLGTVENKADRTRDERKVESFLRAASARVNLLAPVVGASCDKWTVTKKGSLLAPLSLVLGVGDNAAQAIGDAASVKQFNDLFTFLGWADNNRRLVNSKAVLALAMADAFRGYKVPIEQAVDMVKAWVEFKPGKKAGTRVEQLQRAIADNPSEVFITNPDDETAMAFEAHALGFNFWRDAWRVNGRRGKVEHLLMIGRVTPSTDKRLRCKRRALLVTGMRKFNDKKGRQMATLQCRGIEGDGVRVMVFASVWGSIANQIKANTVYLVTGTFDRQGTYLPEGTGSFVNVDSVKVGVIGATP